MKLTLHLENGDLGEKTGVARTTVMGPHEIHVLFDMSRMADPSGDGIRELVMRQLDVALIMMALADGTVPPQHMEGAVETLRKAEENGFDVNWANKEGDA